MSNMTNSTNGTTSYVKTCYVLDDQAEIIITFPTDESIMIHIFALIFVIFLFFTTVCLNGITVFTIWRSRVLREKSSNFTIMLQSIVDFGNGATVMPLFIVHWASEVAGHPSCVTIYILKKFAILMFFYTLTTLSVVNFDRYMGVLHPFVHRHLVTNERLLAYVVTACTIQTIIHAFSLTHNEIARPIMIATAILFISITVFVYLKIFLKIRETNRVGMDLVAANGGSSKTNPPRSNVAASLSKTRSEKANFLKELKAAKSSFLVVICCLVCCVPGTLSFGPLNLKSSFEAIALKIGFAVLAMLNSSLNNVIYFWCNNALRKHGKEVVRNILKSLKRTDS